MKKVVFLGSKSIGYQCLELLINNSNSLNIEIIGVGTKLRSEFGQANSDLSTLASANQIPLINDPNEIPECDFIISVQYNKILKDFHISKAKMLAINLHLAPLPEYRGCNQFSFAILENRDFFGVTIHKITPKIDEGDILFEDRFPIETDIWVNDLVTIASKKGFELFKKSIQNIINGTYTAIPQHTLFASRGTSLHFRNEMEPLKIINLSQDKSAIFRQIRATFMPGFEPPYFMIGSQKIHISPEQRNEH